MSAARFFFILSAGFEMFVCVVSYSEGSITTAAAMAGFALFGGLTAIVWNADAS